jgi:myo-inositol-hexaphosphate 3-phosphohydrolase
VLPYEAQFSVIGLFDKNIRDFAPKSMQFNSVEADQSDELLDIIHWVNENTPARSKIIGSNDWRGWFILELAGNRNFVTYERMGEIFRNATYAPNHLGYLIDTKVSDDSVNQRTNLVLERAKAYSNSLFTVYRIWEFPKNANLVQ